jgi:glutamate--cysteine ligase
MTLDLKRAEARPITSVDDLIAVFRGAERGRERHKLGLEHEKLIYPTHGVRAVPYEGSAGIGALLEALYSAGYEPFREVPGGPLIAARRGEATVSLEPGGQLELSGTAAATAREVHEENLRHLAETKQFARALASVRRGAADALDAQGAVRGHAEYAGGAGCARAGHDADDRHRTSLPGLGG